ncbi:S9 family peptidase [Rhodococcus sp. IEGM 1366]|uniref:S9 family peptidase n=1 Tax=Rhodococcus sp. IEGM 1366 TaxID=3082223 RepID=UPI002955553B|nr:S9 family peptidase [Rhodococcus sp. IEGM 1366]MDV8071428.1 S9 family peptidase [Rhodococcus sp. IEGM 1366]
MTIAPDLIAIDDFFGAPAAAGARISPDGTRIGFLAPWKNRLNVWVQDIAANLSAETDARCVSADKTRSVMHFRWTDDPRWLLYLQDTGGDENYHVFRVDLDDSRCPAVDLTPFPGARAIALEPVRGQAGSYTVLLNARNPAEFDLHTINVATGEIELIGHSSGTDRMVMLGAGGILVEQEMTDDGHLRLSRVDQSGTRHPIASFDATDYPVGITPTQITPDGTGLWMGSTRGRDLTHLVRVDLDSGEETLVDSHPTLELDAVRRAVAQTSPPLICDCATGALLGVRYLGERQEIRALDPAFAEILGALEQLSDGDIGELTSDRSGLRWTVSFVHDRDPSVTYLYDHATGASRRLFRPFPHLDPNAMAPMTPVTITARDGRPLPSYLTLPLGQEPTALPLVLLVHGGPWYRDSWGFDPGVQMLANRGYAVLQVNFRGSTGYGKAHTNAAVGEFAGAMHDDLVDAVDWAVQQGYADRERVAIMGGSYGGYAALVGATFTPDVFAAAVDAVGISDLANFMRTQPPFLRAGLVNNWYRFVGDPSDPEQEADMLARSPITRLDAATAPLLIAQGANDARVTRAESDNVVDILRSCGVDVDYLVFDNEGHGFVNPENNITFYREVERFLAAHLGGRELSPDRRALHALNGSSS